MSDRANVRRATDHGATVLSGYYQSGYYPFGLMSGRAVVCWATGLPGMCP